VPAVDALVETMGASALFRAEPADRAALVAAFAPGAGAPGGRGRVGLWARTGGAILTARRDAFEPFLPAGGEALRRLDVTLLARLDLTGAGIVGAAQTAALFAAHEDSTLSMRHVVRGLVRQYQREARVLTVNDLGAHAIHLTAERS